MELWWHIRGWTRLRLTSADCVSRLHSISREIRIENIMFIFSYFLVAFIIFNGC